MAKNQEAINVKMQDWIKDKLKKECVNEGTVLVDEGGITINFDVLVDSSLVPNVGAMAAAVVRMRKARDAQLIKFQKTVNKQLDQIIERVVELHKQQDSNDSAFSDASSILDKGNKYIKDCVDDVRADVRKALAAELDGVKAKQLTSIGSSKYKELKIARGAFENEVNYDSGSADVSDVLKRNTDKWIYFALLATGTAGLVALDKKKAVTKAEWKILTEQLGGNAKLYEGVLRPTATTVTLRFNGKAQPGNEVIRKAIIASAESFKVSKVSVGDPLKKMPTSAQLKDLAEKE